MGANGYKIRCIPTVIPMLQSGQVYGIYFYIFLSFFLFVIVETQDFVIVAQIYFVVGCSAETQDFVIVAQIYFVGGYPVETQNFASLRFVMYLKRRFNPQFPAITRYI